MNLNDCFRSLTFKKGRWIWPLQIQNRLRSWASWSDLNRHSELAPAGNSAAKEGIRNKQSLELGSGAPPPFYLLLFPQPSPSPSTFTISPPPQTLAEHCTYYVPASTYHPRRVPSEADSPAARVLGTGLGKRRPLCRTGDENWRGAGQVRDGRMGGILGEGLVGRA